MKLKVIFTTIMFACWIPGYSCKCSDPGTVREAYKNTAVVFHGKVLSREIVSFAQTMKTEKANEIREKLSGKNGDAQTLQLFETDFIFKIELRIIEKFKEDVDTTVTVYTPIGGASCGYRFEVNKEYIVYASNKSYAYFPFLNQDERKENIEKENTYWTNHCTRTRNYHKSEVAELRKLKE